jgi:hypothetical protein
MKILYVEFHNVTRKLKTQPLAGNGKIKSNAIMECITPSNITNGSTAGNGELSGSVPIVISCNDRETMGSGVSC